VAGPGGRAAVSVWTQHPPPRSRLHIPNNTDDVRLALLWLATHILANPDPPASTLTRPPRDLERNAFRASAAGLQMTGCQNSSGLQVSSHTLVRPPERRYQGTPIYTHVCCSSFAACEPPWNIIL
jgi:hypothetical protein